MNASNLQQCLFTKTHYILCSRTTGEKSHPNEVFIYLFIAQVILSPKFFQVH